MNKRVEEYNQILERHHRQFAKAASEAQEGDGKETAGSHDSVIYRTGTHVAGPVLYSFVWWVLTLASSRGLHRLYFLARDGRILLKIAQLFCEAYAVDIECRYLHCSRLALRKAAYCLPDHGALDYLFEGGYFVTSRTILMRAGLEEDEASQFLREHLPQMQDSGPLNEKERVRLRQQLEKEPAFLELLRQNSQGAYENCLGYLRQEGMSGGEAFGLVDTGWTGSMQKTIHSILAAGGDAGPMEGFYFGLMNSPAPGTGFYHGWYLRPNSRWSTIGKFNNILLECFCSNESPMTVSYCRTKGRYYPEFKAENPVVHEWNLALQEQAILSFVKCLLPRIDSPAFPQQNCLQMTRDLLDCLFFHPNREEAQAYGSFPFCDDMAEQMLTPIAPKLDQNSIKRYRLSNRVLFSLLPDRRHVWGNLTQPLYWPYGSLELSDIACKELYRYRFYLWSILHHVKRNCKGRKR